jgi:hypothetical protein
MVSALRKLQHAEEHQREAANERLVGNKTQEEKKSGVWCATSARGRQLADISFFGLLLEDQIVRMCALFSGTRLINLH